MSKLDWLYEANPHESLARLHINGELAQFLPEVSALYGIPQSAEHHPEVCTGRHMELCLQAAELMELSPAQRFAVLVHDLGKARTPKSQWPQHIDHERRGVPLVEAVCDRLWIDRETTELALLVCEHHLSVHTLLVRRSTTVVKFLNDTGLEFKPALLHQFVKACEADKRGREGHLHSGYPQGLFLRDAREALEPLPMPAGTTPQSDGAEAQSRHRERLNAVRAVMHKHMVRVDE